MASNSSFDITTGVDLQEVDNAVNQTRKELQHRYDFRGVEYTLELDRAASEVRLTSGDEFHMTALTDGLQGKLVKRGVSLKNVRIGDLEHGAGQSVRCTVHLAQGIEQDTAKRIVKFIKDDKTLRKVQAAIHGDQVRVTGPKKDVLQEVMQRLREEDFGVELEFGNYRG
ncbi:MAG: YajQ family cyclic di-GMP-binding protein [Gemmatimonadales bacterium]